MNIVALWSVIREEEKGFNAEADLTAVEEERLWNFIEMQEGETVTMKEMKNVIKNAAN